LPLPRVSLFDRLAPIRPPTYPRRRIGFGQFNSGKYYSIERAREALGYDPQDNSAHWDGDEKVVDPDRE